jgi:hypothetical protein
VPLEGLSQWTILMNKPGRVVGIATGLGWTVRDQIPVATRFSTTLQNGPRAHPASCTMGTGSFAGVKSCRGVG